MKAKLIQAQDEKTFAVGFDKGDVCIAGLLDFAKQHNLNAAHFTAIGAFSDVTLGFFDRELSKLFQSSLIGPEYSRCAGQGRAT